MGRAFAAILVRDLTLALRHRSELANPLMFFIVVVTLFPLALGPEKDILMRVAPGIIWVAALLAATLSMDGMFRSDFEDGSLEQMLLSPHPPALLVVAKVLAHWLVTGLPLILISPLLALFLHLPMQALPVLLATLALGTPVLSMVGAIGVALTVGLRRGGLLLTLLVIPLYIPVLIFAAGAVDNAAAQLPVAGQLYFLAALLVLALTLAPLATAAALRISVG
ncbi:heme exporter protein CcmB [Thiohalorhabdus methylotrophus]|uniref:Heme exporter protein B n=1 Tax=Thiohalorhabdus methylotrophus TaxID=3242694 RepID=A0ABV4TSK1_9GAMM